MQIKTITTSLLFCIALSIISCKEATTTALNTGNTLKHKAVLEYQIQSKLGEGSFWNYNTQELYWVDIQGKTLHIYNPKTKSNKSITVPSMIGTVVPSTQSNKAIIALQDGIYSIDTNTGDLQLLSDVEQAITTNRFNDGKCDPSGRFWVGSIAFNETPLAAKLYMLDNNQNAILKKDSVTISNGIVWTKDKTTMYYIDTPTSEIKAYDYNDATGAISNERVAVKVSDTLGYPDGMTIDEHDNLWVGLWNGSAVGCFNPKTGNLISKIEVPALNVTSCAFGGKNLDTLYITTATKDMDTEQLKQFPLAGSIFKAVPGVKGVKGHFYKE